jgi:hypothetical protein
MVHRALRWLLLAGGFPLAIVACGSSKPDVVDETAAGSAAEWVELPTPPLGPRSHVVGVWSGREVFYVGGDTFLCPPNASCDLPDDPPLADGAAFDPSTVSWREIAPSPVAFSWASTAVIGDDIYFLVAGSPDWRRAEAAFLRYSIGADAWEELPQPAGDLGWYQLDPADGVVVAFSSSHEAGGRPDLMFDPSGGGIWEELPPDPLAPGYDRTMVWSRPYLYLFDHEIVPNPTSGPRPELPADPPLTRAARLDLSTGEWERLPDSEILGTGPWFVEDEIMVNPNLGSADGGEVNSWGRRYPFGGIFDTSSATWSELPEAPHADIPAGVFGDDISAGVLGSTDALMYATEGWLLDLGSGSWIELPQLPGSGGYTQRIVVTAGADAVVFGGERWSDDLDLDDGELLGDAWIWRSGRTP